MAFGGLKGYLTGSAGSITNPFDATGSVVVAVGDLVFAALAEQTGITVTGMTDNLGNSYSPVNAGSDAGTATMRCFYSVVTVAGTLTAVHAAATGSTHDVAFAVEVIEGPVSVIDANPANSTSGVTSPFSCPATGTLGQANEIVVAAICGYWSSGNVAFAATSPNLLGRATNYSGGADVAVGYQAVSSTSTVTPVFTASANPSQAVKTTASFRKGHLLPPTGIATAASDLGHPALTQFINLAADPIATQAASLGHPALSINGAVTQIFVADAMNRADQNTGSMRAICTLSDDSQGSIRVKWACLPSSGANWYGSEVQHMSFGKWDGNTSSADTTATPIELKFSGASGFDLSGAPQDVEATIWSDWTEHPGITLNAGDKVVIIWDTNPAIWNHSAQETTTGASSNNKTWLSSGTSWDQQNVTGWTSLTEGFCIEEIDTQAAGGGGADVDLVATGIATGAASLDNPALAQVHVLTAAPLATQAASLGQPAISQKHVLTVNPIATAAASLGTPALSQSNILTANALATGAASLGQPAFSQNHHIGATAFATQAASLGTPAISQCHVLTANPIATQAASLGSPVFSNFANPLPAANALATGAAFLGQPAFTQRHVLVGSAFYTGPPSLGTPAISQTHALTASPLATASPSLGTPALSQNHKLTATPFATGAAGIPQPTLGIAGIMAATPLATGSPGLGHPALSQNHKLTAATLATGAADLGHPVYIRNLVASALGTAAASLGSPVIHQAHVLGATALGTASPALGQPAIAQNQGLAATPLATGAPSLGRPTLSQNHHLSASGLAGQKAAPGTPALGQRHALAADDLATGSPDPGQPEFQQHVQMAADGLATGAASLGDPAFFNWEPLSLITVNDLVTASPYLGHPALAQIFRTTRPGREVSRSVQRLRMLLNLDSRERTLVRKQHRIRTIKRQ